MKQIQIKTPTIKLNNLLKLASVAMTGGEAKSMILDDEVKVNGEVCNIIRKQIKPGDVVSCFGEDYKVVAESDAD